MVDQQAGQFVITLPTKVSTVKVAVRRISSIHSLLHLVFLFVPKIIFFNLLIPLLKSNIDHGLQTVERWFFAGRKSSKIEPIRRRSRFFSSPFSGQFLYLLLCKY